MKWGAVWFIVVLLFVAYCTWAMWSSERIQQCVDRELSQKRPTLDCFKGDKP